MEKEYPWLVGLYFRNKSGLWDQKCGGTLVSTRLVITAAQCLWTSDFNHIKPEDIRIGLGKNFRDFYNEEPHTSIAYVKWLGIPDNFVGPLSSYALDLALLELTDRVRTTPYIMPACFDWNSNLAVRSGDVGHVAGWGLTDAHIPNEKMRAVQVTYLDNTSCLKKLQSNYKKFLTHDKFCATSHEGAHLDKGDAGSGLTIVNEGRHYLTGVVSTRIREEDSFVFLTDLKNTQHLAWLNNIRANTHRHDH